MGLTCLLWRVPEADVDRLPRDAEGLRRFLYGESPPRPTRGGLLGFLQRLSPITIETAGSEDLGQRAGHPPGIELHLGKAWHGLHYLFTGTAWKGDEPACFLVRGGEDVGAEEIGDSFPRLLRPPQVRAFSDSVAAFTGADLRQRFDPARMIALEIYPEPLWEREGREAADYLLSAARDLRGFLRTAADAGDGVIIHLS